MAKTPYMYTVTGVMRKVAAEEMTAQTPYTITADMVSYVQGEDDQINVFASQVGNVTVLCGFRPYGKCIVKTVEW